MVGSVEEVRGDMISSGDKCILRMELVLAKRALEVAQKIIRSDPAHEDNTKPEFGVEVSIYEALFDVTDALEDMEKIK